MIPSDISAKRRRIVFNNEDKNVFADIYSSICKRLENFGCKPLKQGKLNRYHNLQKETKYVTQRGDIILLISKHQSYGENSLQIDIPLTLSPLDEMTLVRDILYINEEDERIHLI